MVSLADSFLPRFQFYERHEERIAAHPNQILDAIIGLRNSDDALVRALIMLREAPVRIANAVGLSSGRKKRPPFGMENFTVLGRNDRELVYGLVGRFWRPSFGLFPIADASAFQNFHEPGVAKLLMNFAVSPIEKSNDMRLVTETKILCSNRWSFFMCAIYWGAIRIASGLVRRRMLAVVRRKAESTITL
jgi:hypothetical protein